MKLTLPLLFISIMFISAVHCKDKKKPGGSTALAAEKELVTATGSYDLSKPVIRKLHRRLNEISGINYLDKEKFAAEEDENGNVYILDFKTGDIDNTFNFGPPGDYEDIVTLKDYYYLLNSNGDIYKVDRKNPAAATTKIFKFGKPDTEFESLYADADGKRLVLICKACSGNGHNTSIPAFGFDLQKETYSNDPVFSIEEAPVRKLLQIGKGKFKPSSAAIHPIEKKLYVLCSTGRLLLVCSLSGVVESAWPLELSLYNQPEGITFAPNGDMYISNEAGESKATILKLAYLKK